MGIGRGDSEVLEAEVCQSPSFFVADVAIGPSISHRAVEADPPFRRRELAEERADEPVAQPGERRSHRRARENDRGEGHIQWGAAAGGIRPVDDHRAAWAEHHVRRMKVEVQDGGALAS